MKNKCIYFKSVSKIQTPPKCDGICSRKCKAMRIYKQLLKENKVDIIYDMANNRS